LNNTASESAGENLNSNIFSRYNNTAEAGSICGFGYLTDI